MVLWKSPGVSSIASLPLRSKPFYRNYQPVILLVEISFYVLPNWQGKAIATQTVSSLRNAHRTELGFTHLIAYSILSNFNSQGFFKRQGLMNGFIPTSARMKHHRRCYLAWKDSFSLLILLSIQGKAIGRTSSFTPSSRGEERRMGLILFFDSISNASVFPTLSPF